MKDNNSIKNLISNVNETANRFGIDSNECKMAVYDLAPAIVHGILKNIIPVQNNPNIIERMEDSKKSIGSYQNNMARINAIIENEDNYKHWISRTGERRTKHVNKMDKAIGELLDYTIGEGMDLVNQAWIETMEELKKMDSPYDLEKPYEEKALKRNWKTIAGTFTWEEKERIPFKEIQKRIRAYILNYTNIELKYCYIEWVEDSEEENELYLRLPKNTNEESAYYRMKDIMEESPILERDNTLSVQEMVEILEKYVYPSCSEKQHNCLSMYLSGKTYSEIAIALGISRNTVTSAIREAKKKVNKVIKR